MAEMTGALLLAEKYMGREVDNDAFAETEKLINELMQNPNPTNKYEIAQIVARTVDTIIRERLTFLEDIGDVQRVGFGDKLQFDVKTDGIKAYVQAKGSTTRISKVAHDSVEMETVEVGARPKINMVKWLAGQVSMMDVIDDAVRKMEQAVIGNIQASLNATLTALGAGVNYGTAAGVDKTVIDPMVHFVSRFGQPVIFGDIAVVSQLIGLTGYTDSSDALINEQNENGYIGRYIGANVFKLNNTFQDDSSVEDSNLVVDNAWMYIVPAGDTALRPLKIGYEGDVHSVEQVNINDHSWEISLKMFFGSLVVGNQYVMAGFEDSSL